MALKRLACSDPGPPVCLSALTHKSVSHKIPACAMMQRNFHINPRRRGLISMFTVEVSDGLYGPISI
jgi:hypothetical protein